MCQEVLVPLWRVAGYGGVVNVTLNECAMACIVSKPRGSKSIKQSHKTPPTAQAASRALPHLPFMCFLAFLPFICWWLGEKRNYVRTYSSVSYTKNLFASDVILRCTIQSESPPWCRSFSISTLISDSACRIRASLTRCQQLSISAWDGCPVETQERFSSRAFLRPDAAVSKLTLALQFLVIMAGAEKDLRLFAKAERPCWGREAILGTFGCLPGRLETEMEQNRANIYSWNATLGRQEKCYVRMSDHTSHNSKSNK